MELVASLPSDWLAVADPAARGPAPLLAPAESDALEGAVAGPFDLLLALLAAPPPSGELLPVVGNPLPPPMALSPAGADAAINLPSTVAAPIAAALGEVPSAPGLSRFELSAELRAALPPLPLSTPAPAVALPLASPIMSALAVDADASPSLPSGSAVVPAGLEPLSMSTPAAVVPLRSTAPEAAPAIAATERAAPASVRAAAALESTVAGLAPSDSPSLSRRRPDSVAARLVTTPVVGVESRPVAVASVAVAPAMSAVAPSVVAKAVPREDGVAVASAWLPSVAELDASAPGASASPWSPAPTAGVTPHTAAHTLPLVPQTPVDLRAPSWHEAFASRIQWLVDQQVGEARIKLNPPELGAVDVKISLVDDKTYVQLTAASAGARDELAQSLPRLRELFVASGLELGGASVHGGSGGRAGHDSGARAVPQLAELAAFDHRHESPRPIRATAGRIDVFA